MKLDQTSYRDLFDLTNRVALVVGGASGIGRAGAIGLADFGAKCVIADIDLTGAEATVAEIRRRGGSADARAADVRSTPSVEALVQGVLRDHGAIDVLLAMPAINIRKRLVDYADEEFDRVIDLNLKGTFRVGRAVARVMAQQNRGSMIFMSSMRASNVEPGQSIYGSTKAAIGLMTRGLASEMARHKVRVNALAPSIVATPINQIIRDNPEWNDALAKHTALERWADASEMVGPIVFLASEASSYVTGTTLFADAGWTVIDGRYAPPV
ncbi:MAG: SDR family oxidoreductase [Betaproteobacteria bacterium]|nr:SDR family oxidoreductase [Betaproteobacteria bacterium]